MSKTVDERVVQMEFDNKQFEQNVQTSMNTLDKLKQALNLDGATKGLQEVDRASRNVNMSGLSNAVETVKMKFSAMEVVAITALANITNSAINAGKNLISSLTIAPIKQGFDEYELKMNSVQTIMASTGENIETVNKYLEELNLYADRTIYSFSDMTSNIGKFTNAGVKLEDAVKAIQGISNEAAVSGANANEASRAMYNFAQALSAGYVKLIDWKSIENANMATVEFKQSLLDTALAMGTVVKEGDKYVTTTTDAQGKVSDLFDATHMFNDSLSNQWMTTEVLVQTLNNYSTDVREMSEAEKKAYEEKLRGVGYTEDQIAAIEKLGMKAFDAAQDVKTFSQLMDTLRESVGSGWSQTFEILFGDLEEAKSLWSGIYKVVGGFIDESSKARNEMLKTWADLGGREALLQSFKNIFEGILSVVKPIGDAIKEIFPPIAAENLVKLTESFKNFTATLKLSDQSAENLKLTFKGVFSVFHTLGTVLTTVIKTLFPVTESFGGIVDILLSFTARIGQVLTKGSEAIERFVVKLDQPLSKIREFIHGVAEAIKNFASIHFGVPDISPLDEFTKKLQTRLQPLTKVGDVVRAIFDKMYQLFKAISPVIARIGEIIINTISDISNRILNALHGEGFNSLLDLFNGGLLAGIGIGIYKFVNKLKDLGNTFDDLIGKFVGEGSLGARIANTLDMARDSFQAFTANIKADTLTKLAKAIAILAASLVAISLIDSDKLSGALAAITVLIGELYAVVMVLEKSSILEKLNTSALSSLQTSLIKMASAILILAVALKTIGSLDLASIAKGLVGIAGIMAEMIAFVYVFNKLDSSLVDSGSIRKMATSMTIMGVALIALGAALRIIGTMDLADIGKGLLAIGGSLTIMVAAFNLIDDKGIIAKSAAILIIADALVVLGAALRIIGGMDIAAIGKALLGLAGSMAILVTSFKLLGDAKHMVSTAAAMLLIADAMVVLGAALRIMGGMSIEQVGKSLLSLAGSMTVLVAAFNLINPEHIIAKAGALSIMALALVPLAAVLKILGSMDILQIIGALAALAGTFAIFGAAASLLSALIPAMYGLAGAVALLGVGVAACGVGVMALAAGLTALAAAGTAAAAAAVAALEIVIVGFLNIIANSAEALARAIKAIVLSTVDVIVSCAPAIIEGIMVLIDECLKSLAVHTPNIVNYLMDFLIGLINGIAERLPELIEAVFNLVGKFFEGIINSLKKIDVQSLIDAVAAVGLLSGIMVALGALSSLVPSAMAGLLGLGAVIAEMGVILAALGALKQIPGLQWLIDEGGAFLESIGKAIGRFIGGIAGGITEGVTDSLPRVATSLSLFMENLEPFIKGAKSIDSGLMDGVKSLAETILVLTGANILDSLTSWFTGGSSLARFGEELAAFGPSFKTYADSVKDIDPNVISASADAARALSELSANLPKEGGLSGLLFGSSNLEQFGQQLTAFGQSMKSYSDEIGDIKPDVVVSSANAAKALAELANNLPSNGGLTSLIFGRKSLADFGEELTKFAEPLAEYSKTVNTVDPDVVVNSANAAKALSELENNLPSSGGLASLIFGEKSLSTFGEEVAKFGPHIAAYSDAIKNVSGTDVVASANAAKSLAELANNLPDSDGLKNLIFGSKSLSKFGEELAAFGPNLAKYSESIESVSGSNVVSSANAAKVLAEFVNGLDRTGGIVGFGQDLLFGSKDLVGLGKKLAEFAPYLKEYSNTISEGGFNDQAVIGSANAAKSLAEFANNLPNDQERESLYSFLFGHQESLSKFGKELAEFAPYLVSFSSAITKEGNGFSASAVESSANAAKCLAEFASEIGKEGGLVEEFIGKNIPLSKFGLQLAHFAPYIAEYANTVKDINPNAVEGSANAAKTLGELMNILPREGGILNNLQEQLFGKQVSVSDFGEQLKGLGEAIWKYSVWVRGIDVDAVTGSANAAKTLAELAQILPRSADKDNIFSWFYGTQISYEEFGKQITAFAEALASYSTTVSEIEDPNGMVDKSISIAKALIELANALPQIGGLIGAFTGEQDLGKFGDGLKKFGEGIKEYANQVSSITNIDQLPTIIEDTRKLMDMIQSANLVDTAGFVNFANDLRIVGNRGIYEFVSAFEGCYDAVQTAIDSFIEILRNTVAEKTPGIVQACKGMGSAAGQGILDGFTEMGPFISQAAVTISSGFINNLKVALPYSTFKEIGAQNVIQAMIDGINSKKEFLYAIVKNICLNVISVVKNNLAILFQVGAYAIEQLANGMLSMYYYLELAVHNICAGAANYAYDLLPEVFYKIGQFTVEGLIEGMQSMEDELVEYMKYLASLMMAAFEGELEINSPSKVFYRYGGFVGMGLVNGIQDMEDQVLLSTTDLAAAAISPMKDAIDRIADVVNENIDIDPVITPVIDLSQVETGAAKINKMLNKGIDLTASYNKAVTATSNNKNQVQDTQQNKSEPQTTTINQNFTQNNYSPKALSRKEIYRQTRNQFSAMRGAVSGV